MCKKTQSELHWMHFSQIPQPIATQQSRKSYGKQHRSRSGPRMLFRTMIGALKFLSISHCIFFKQPPTFLTRDHAMVHMRGTSGEMTFQLHDEGILATRVAKRLHPYGYVARRSRIAMASLCALGAKAARVSIVTTIIIEFSALIKHGGFRFCTVPFRACKVHRQLPKAEDVTRFF